MFAVYMRAPTAGEAIGALLEATLGGRVLLTGGGSQLRRSAWAWGKSGWDPDQFL